MASTVSVTNEGIPCQLVLRSHLPTRLRTRYSGFWRELRRQREALVQEIGLDELQTSASELPSDLIDQAAVDQERELCVQTKGRAYGKLRQIDSALLRMERGTYGLCIRCNKEIPLARLEVQPTAATCVACQEWAERGLHDAGLAARPTRKRFHAKR